MSGAWVPAAGGEGSGHVEVAGQRGELEQPLHGLARGDELEPRPPELLVLVGGQEHPEPRGIDEPDLGEIDPQQWRGAQGGDPTAELQRGVRIDLTDEPQRHTVEFLDLQPGGVHRAEGSAAPVPEVGPC